MDFQTLYDNSKKFVYSHDKPKRTMKNILMEMANYIGEDDKPDNYGKGKFIVDFEKKIADILGKQSAVFMPSGTMAQQIALRIWCEKKNNFNVAFHPTAHLEIAEYLGYNFLHNIKRIQFNAPEFEKNRLLTLNDFKNLKSKPSVILIELPQREIGFRLPSWNELTEISDWCKEEGIILHLDGARLWECKPFYNKSYSDICKLFDTIYVSFYKGLGGICGSILSGTEDFINESKLWQRRMGGNLKTMFPYVLTSKQGIENILPKMDAYYKKTLDFAKIFDSYKKVELIPNPPQTPHFQIVFKTDKKNFYEDYEKTVEKTKLMPFFPPNEGRIPGVLITEMFIGENALEISEDELSNVLNLLNLN